MKIKTAPNGQENRGSIPLSQNERQESNKPGSSRSSLPAHPESGFTYKGFLYMRCPRCGEVYSFCMKNPADNFKCRSCGSRTPFMEPLIPMHVFCECGGKFRYYTNITDPVIEMRCIDCGSPIDLYYNKRKKIYETMK